MEWWKVIVGPLVVIAIVGSFTFFVGRITAPDTASVEAEIKWVDVPNPLQSTLTFIPSSELERLDKLIQLNFKMIGATAALRKVQFLGTVRIAVLTLANNTNVRSKQVEVSGSADALLFSGDAAPAQTEYVSKLKIKSLDPGTDATVYVISNPWTPYDSNPVRVLYDDRKVDVKLLEVSEDWQWATRIISGYPILTLIIAVLSFLSFLILCVVLPLGIIYNMNMPFRAKMTTEKDAKKLRAFMDYLAEHYPEKLKPT